MCDALVCSSSAHLLLLDSRKCRRLRERQSAFCRSLLMFTLLVGSLAIWPQLHDLDTPCSANYSTACAIREAGRLVAATSLGFTRVSGNDCTLRALVKYWREVLA